MARFTWAMALATLGLPSAAAAQQPADSGPVVSAYLVVIAGTLNVRERPSLDAPVVGTIPRGQRLCVRRYSGDWAEIAVVSESPRPDTLQGFVSRGFVSETRVERVELEQLGCIPRDPPPR